jgi:hypothetical protein
MGPAKGKQAARDHRVGNLAHRIAHRRNGTDFGRGRLPWTDIEPFRAEISAAFLRDKNHA